MTEATEENLSEREKACLAHLRQAQELGVSFAEYCRTFELNVNQWYPLKQALTRKGILAGEKSNGEEEERNAGFAPVRVVASPRSSAPAARLRHVSGWTIELPVLPPVSWMKELMAGEAA